MDVSKRARQASPFPGYSKKLKVFKEENTPKSMRNWNCFLRVNPLILTASGQTMRLVLNFQNMNLEERVLSPPPIL
jgi:hypothetical protein